MNHAILIFAQNKPGVLTKIATVLRRKIYNVETITACETEHNNITRIVITFAPHEGERINHIIKQIGKIVEVISIKQIFPESSIQNEAFIIKSKVNPGTAKHITSITPVNGYFLIKGCGDQKEVDEVIKVIGEENIIKLARTGITAIDLE